MSLRLRFIKLASCELASVIKRGRYYFISAGEKNGAKVFKKHSCCGGHTWPSGNQYLSKDKIGPVSYDLSFDQIWEFFKNHPKE